VTDSDRSDSFDRIANRTVLSSGFPKRKAVGRSFSPTGKDFSFFGKGPGFESRDSLFLFLKFALGVLGHDE
jgi:hypothetical protein